MEKTMTMNVKVVGFDKEKGMVQDRKRDHLTIWREIFRDARSQWEEAEYGRSPQWTEMVQDRKQGHVKAWLEVLREARSQWEEAEFGRFHKTLH
jgi:hypothetical protein